MHKIRRLAMVTGFVLVFAVSTMWAKQTVRGTIERVEGQTLVVKSRDGAELKVVLADNVLVVGIVKAHFRTSLYDVNSRQQIQH